MDVFDSLGLPPGVANLVTGAGATAGAPLSSHPDVDLISFTGGVVTGRKIAAAASETVKKIALELGGKTRMWCSPTRTSMPPSTMRSMPDSLTQGRFVLLV